MLCVDILVVMYQNVYPINYRIFTINQFFNPLEVDMELTSIIVALIGIFSGVGFWTYASKRAELKATEERALHNLLIGQVQELKTKVDVLISDKEDLLMEIANLREELASTKAELHAVNNLLRYQKGS